MYWHLAALRIGYEQPILAFSRARGTNSSAPVGYDLRHGTTYITGARAVPPAPCCHPALGHLQARGAAAGQVSEKARAIFRTTHLHMRSQIIRLRRNHGMRTRKGANNTRLIEEGSQIAHLICSLGVERFKPIHVKHIVSFLLGNGAPHRAVSIGNSKRPGEHRPVRSASHHPCPVTWTGRRPTRGHVLIRRLAIPNGTRGTRLFMLRLDKLPAARAWAMTRLQHG